MGRIFLDYTLSICTLEMDIGYHVPGRSTVPTLNSSTLAKRVHTVTHQHGKSEPHVGDVETFSGDLLWGSCGVLMECKLL